MRIGGEQLDQPARAESVPAHLTPTPSTTSGPAPGRPAAPPRALNGQAMLRLQRSAGNSAVSRLVSRPGHGAVGAANGQRPGPTDAAGVTMLDTAGDAPLPVQRKAGGACGCASSCGCDGRNDDVAEGNASQGVVQRLSVSDVAGAVLPKWVTDLVEGVPAQARSMASTLTGGKATMEGKAAAAAGQAEAKAGGQAEQQSQAAEGGARAAATSAESTAAATDQRAARDASQVDSAATNMPTIGSLVGPLLNPATPTIDMDQVSRAAERAGKVLQGIPEGSEKLRSDVVKAVKDGTAADGQPGWNCDQAEIMSMVGGVGRAVANAGVRAGKAILGEERYNRLVTFVNDKIAEVQKTVAGIRAGIDTAVTTLSKAWEKATKPLVESVQTLMKDAAKLADELAGKVRVAMDLAIKGAQIIWKGIEDNVIKPFIELVSGAKARIETAVQNAIKSLGTWWKKLPTFVQGGLLGAAALVAGPAALALAAAYKAGQLLMANKDKLIAKIRARIDKAVSTIGGWYQKARKAAEGVIAKIAARGRQLIDDARKAAAKAAALVDKHTPQWVKDLRAAAERMRKKIAGEVCTTLGETAGPCAEQFVPDLGPNATPGASHDVTVQATGEMTVVVEGVPVKVAGGASVALSRVGKVYTVVVSGEGAVAVTTPPAGGGGGGGAKVEVELPGALGDAQKAWKGLTGKQPPAAAPAPGAAPTPGAAAPPVPAAGAKPATPGQPGQAAPGTAAPAAAPKTASSASAEAGYKGKVEMTYVFDGSKPGADTTCDGVGGMTAMLAGLGVGALMPAPFNALGGGVQGDYSNHLTACSVTLSEYGNVKVDVKNDGVGGIEAAVTGEAGVTVGRAREVDAKGNITGGWVDTATVFGSLSGSLAGSLLLRADPKISLGGKATASGKLSASLSYDEKQGKISAMSVGGSVSFGLGLSLPQISDVLPEPIATAVNKALEPYLTVARGTVEASASLSFNNLHTLLGALDAYVTANGERCNAQGVIDVVTSHFSKEGNLTTSLTVVLKVSKSLAKVSVEAGGEGASGKAEISVTENQTIPLYPVAAPLPLPSSTPATKTTPAAPAANPATPASA